MEGRDIDRFWCSAHFQEDLYSTTKAQRWAGGAAHTWADASGLTAAGTWRRGRSETLYLTNTSGNKHEKQTVSAIYHPARAIHAEHYVSLWIELVPQEKSLAVVSSRVAWGKSWGEKTWRSNCSRHVRGGEEKLWWADSCSWAWTDYRDTGFCPTPW